MATTYEEAVAEHDVLANQVRAGNAGNAAARRARHRQLRTAIVELFRFARERGIPPEQARPRRP